MYETNGIKIYVLENPFAISEWQEDQNFNYAFHQHYPYKGQIIDGITEVPHITLSDLPEVLDNSDEYDV